MFAAVTCYREYHQIPPTAISIKNWQKTGLIIDIAMGGILTLAAIFVILSSQGYTHSYTVKILFGMAGTIVAVDILSAIFVKLKKRTEVQFIANPIHNAQPTYHGANPMNPPQVASSSQKTHLQELHEFTVISRLRESDECQEIMNVTSFNAGMLPGWVNQAQQIGSKITGFFSSIITPIVPPKAKILDHPEKRAQKIAEKFAQDSSAILCGQEVFSPDATKILIQSLKEKYHIVHSIGTSSVVSSGLFFASSYPISQKEVRYWKFTNLGGEDALSCKGLLRAPVEMPSKEGPKQVIFYNTHLQAKFGEKYDKIRREQLRSILQEIQKDQKEHPQTPIFLLGDLNITDVEIKNRITSDYTKLKGEFFSFFHDFYLVDHNADCERIQAYPLFLPADKNNDSVEPQGSFYDMEKPDTFSIGQKTRYDYCLLFNPTQKNLSMVHSHSEFRRIMETPSVNPPLLSDHLPLTTQIEVKDLFLTFT